MKDVVMVVDLQYGSTGKGQIAGAFGRRWEPDTVVCANGPNAGHTYRWSDGYDEGEGQPTIRQTINTVMPVTSVLPSVRNILIGPGAVIDLEKLQTEIQLNLDLLADKRLIIHPNAAIVTQRHREAEKALVSVGSTMKGTSEAVIEKMRRSTCTNLARHYSTMLTMSYATEGHRCFQVLVNTSLYEQAIDSSDRLLVEGAQGASLSIHSKFFPYTTSRDVGINQIWADCRLPAVTDSSYPDGSINVIGVARTYPIRVANRYDRDSGEQVGYSGDCYEDQQEIRWTDIGREAELTTVTKLPRRLFTFSTQQIMDSVRYNAPTAIALTFCDYLPSHNQRHPNSGCGTAPQWPIGPGELLSPCVAQLVNKVQAIASCPVNYVSFGPNDTDLFSVSPFLPLRLSTELWLPRSSFERKA